MGEMWGVSKPELGHCWQVKKYLFINDKILFYLIRFGDEMIIPDPRGMVDTEEHFLEQYESAVKYEDYICIFVFSIAANEPLAKNYKRRVAL